MTLYFYFNLEVLFNPHLSNLKAKGIAQLLYDSISRCDENMKEELWSNVHLVGMYQNITKQNLNSVLNFVLFETFPLFSLGGVARTKNFKNRLLQEVQNLLIRQHRIQHMKPHTTTSKVPKIVLNEHPYQNFAAWLGNKNKTISKKQTNKQTNKKWSETNQLFFCFVFHFGRRVNHCTKCFFCSIVDNSRTL
jgi:actin-related protein